MAYPSLFPELDYHPSDGNKIVNVASVPQRSPFRYPGGKTWLVPRIRRWFATLPTRPSLLIEPFAGGGIISLTVAFEQLACQVTMVERDEQVAAVWDTIIHGDARWLAERILNFNLTPETVQTELARKNLTSQELAFQTILCNRVHHGGILAPGSGIIKFGENGKGLMSRWYPQTLHDRILAITTVRERVEFVQGDGLAVIRANVTTPDIVFFVDPPYTAAGKKAGKRLYTYNALDHEELFQLLETVQGDFLMTYDNAAGVKKLAEQHGFDTAAISMKNTHHAEMTELLIGRNLEWLRKVEGVA